MSYFLWPEGRVHWRACIKKPGTGILSIEERLDRLYPGARPVLFPSARAGLSAIIETLQLGRSQKVGIPPFASHCVWNAVSWRADPVVPSTDMPVSAYVVYHQWGYTHRCSSETILIEDSADSLCLPGRPLFPNGGRFEILSLPKILGTLCGGVVFCRRQDDADRVRAVREARPGRGWTQFALRVLMRYGFSFGTYWQGAEFLNGGIPAPACADILDRLESLDQIISSRRAHLEKVVDLLPAWAKPEQDRLPCAVPVLCTDRMAATLHTNGLISRPRHFNRSRSYPNTDMVRVVPVPVHQDVPVEWLTRVRETLAPYRSETQ
ncbi:MAG: putative PLP-dependent aminotransferase [Elusimicrobiota bacterium]|jgi:putative PLP-dependent aminotransferase (TIGR04422 family)